MGMGTAMPGCPPPRAWLTAVQRPRHRKSEPRGARPACSGGGSSQKPASGERKGKKKEEKKKKGSQSNLTLSRDKNTTPPVATAEDVRAVTQAPRVFSGKSLPGLSRHAINLRDALDFIKML